MYNTYSCVWQLRSDEQKGALFGFGMPTEQMLSEWKRQQAEAELLMKAVALSLESPSFLVIGTWERLQIRIYRELLAPPPS